MGGLAGTLNSIEMGHGFHDNTMTDYLRILIAELVAVSLSVVGKK